MSICNLCYKEYDGDELINRYCPECRETFKDTYEIQVYELRLAIEEVKKAIKTAWKDIFT